jgi:hypothetical protein
MCFVAAFDFSPGKSAGENSDWQAAKTKIQKNRAPEIPDGGGHRTPKTIRWPAITEGRFQQALYSTLET